LSFCFALNSVEAQEVGRKTEESQISLGFPDKESLKETSKLR